LDAIEFPFLEEATEEFDVRLAVPRASQDRNLHGLDTLERARLDVSEVREGHKASGHPQRLGDVRVGVGPDAVVAEPAEGAKGGPNRQVPGRFDPMIHLYPAPASWVR